MNETNERVLHELFTSLNEHDHEGMAACYSSDARFRDIAFDLQGSKLIHAMWHMICETDIRAAFQIVSADENNGRVSLIDDYTFGPPPSRAVHNIIDSHFAFRNGLIVRHLDYCDSRKWAAMAIGGIPGFLAGRFRFLRSYQATRLLRQFIKRHPGYL